MPGETVFGYTDSQAKWNETGSANQDSTTINLGYVDDEAAWWWAAILAPGEGWKASIAHEKGEFKSPWSISIESVPQLTLLRRTRSSPKYSPAAAASSTAAIGFLSDHITLHDVADQSHAALSAALLLPVLNNSGRNVVLPLPRLPQDTNLEPPISLQSGNQIHRQWVQEEGGLIDKLLTLSCYTDGMWALLSSVFYERDIPCNLVSPWLQSIFAVLNPINDNHTILAHILINRAPGLSFLWLGGVIMGVHKHVFGDARFGMIPVNLHSAAWMGTMQSFIQEPVSLPWVVESHVRRSDECRLLYLAQTEFRTRVPMCQWMPFRVTAVEDTDVNIRLHLECSG